MLMSAEQVSFKTCNYMRNATGEPILSSCSIEEQD